MGSKVDAEISSAVKLTLESRGVLGELQAALRANVFKALEEQGAVQDTQARAAIQRTEHAELALEVVRDLLTELGLEYTLSVLKPEAGLGDRPRNSRAGLAADLGLSKPGTGPLLTQLLAEGGSGVASSGRSGSASSGVGSSASSAARNSSTSSSTTGANKSNAGGSSGSSSKSGGSGSAPTIKGRGSSGSGGSFSTTKSQPNKKASSSSSSSSSSGRGNAASSLSSLSDLPGLASPGGDALAKKRADIDKRIAGLEDDDEDEGDIYSDDFSDSLSEELFSDDFEGTSDDNF